MGTDRLEAKIINIVIVFIILARGQAVQTGVDNPSKLQCRALATLRVLYFVTGSERVKEPCVSCLAERSTPRTPCWPGSL